VEEEFSSGRSFFVAFFLSIPRDLAGAPQLPFLPAPKMTLEEHYYETDHHIGE